ncbi:hypothetical protein HYPSUDRAFT_217095 [Hypholoma sublateritium FD-334 SS-4]|uniref:Ribosome biogenesis protein NSA1 n=1 Tax=Hypholoma sublateritium (strain FD-334 SS-4) TaxID=945553 RepID=A0A0D2NN31_HYPSF|nr:hypothetical protein HYPSUDRAFT_217095 [Hypholoma sublateritium FD-334 SS-4]
MSRFLLGDDLGNIKTLRYISTHKEEVKTRVTTVYKHDSSHEPASVQQLASSSQTNGLKALAAAFSNGSCFISTVNEDDVLEVLSEWKEPRSGGSKFVGIALTEDSVFTCTSNGMLRKSAFTAGQQKDVFKIPESHCGTLPSRLLDWRLSEDTQTFAYGGDEVDLSVWNTELAFESRSSPALTSGPIKKRKRNDDLFPGEIWRARNIPNDHLNLRHPIRITALSYLSSSAVSNNLVAGTQFGDLRRYDTRAARRPVSNWTAIAKVGGIKSMQKGLADHELFIADGGSSLYAIDLRTGKILYGYKGLSGAVTSIAPSPMIMASTALDRYVRVHSLVSPPPVAGSHQERKGGVLEKAYVTSIPTVIIWDKTVNKTPSEEYSAQDDDDVWNNMENIS